MELIHTCYRITDPRGASPSTRPLGSRNVASCRFAMKRSISSWGSPVTVTGSS